jgi:hypothetical protein
LGTRKFTALLHNFDYVPALSTSLAIFIFTHLSPA